MKLVIHAALACCTNVSAQKIEVILISYNKTFHIKLYPFMCIIKHLGPQFALYSLTFLNSLTSTPQGYHQLQPIGWRGGHEIDGGGVFWKPFLQEKIGSLSPKQA
jgi:hypothetical protein